MERQARRHLSECRGKVAFLTAAQAEDGLRSYHQHTGYTGRVYECAWCGYYHFGQLGKKRQAMKEGGTHGHR